MRNSPQAVAHLLTKSNTTHILVGPEAQYQQLAAEAMKIMREAGTPIPDQSEMFTFEDVMKGDEPFEPLPHFDSGWDDTALLLHSSGEHSTRRPM